jgi:hypothetical protein
MEMGWEPLGAISVSHSLTPGPPEAQLLAAPNGPHEGLSMKCFLGRGERTEALRLRQAGNEGAVESDVYVSTVLKRKRCKRWRQS